jgi:hypothetical protein
MLPDLRSKRSLVWFSCRAVSYCLISYLSQRIMKKMPKCDSGLKASWATSHIKGNVRYVHGGSNEAATAGPSNGAL